MRTDIFGFVEPIQNLPHSFGRNVRQRADDAPAPSASTQPGHGDGRINSERLESLPHQLMAEILRRSTPETQATIVRDAVMRSAERNRDGSIRSYVERGSSTQEDAVNRTLVGDIVLLFRHPGVRTALQSLLPGVSVPGLHRLSQPAEIVVQTALPVVQQAALLRRDAFTARCVWGALLSHGSDRTQRAFALALVVPDGTRADGAVRNAGSLLAGPATLGTGVEPLNTIRAYAAADFSPQYERFIGLRSPSYNASPLELQNARRMGAVIMAAIARLPDEMRAAGLQIATDFSVRHNLAEMQEKIVADISPHIHTASSNPAVYHICKTLLRDRAFNQSDLESGEVYKSGLAYKPHYAQLATALSGAEHASPEVYLLAAAGRRNDWRDWPSIRTVLRSSAVSEAVRADFFEALEHFRDAYAFEPVLPYWETYLPTMQISSDPRERSAQMRLLRHIAEVDPTLYFDVDENVDRYHELQTNAAEKAKRLLASDDLAAADAFPLARAALPKLPINAFAGTSLLPADRKNIIEAVLHFAEDERNLQSLHMQPNCEMLENVYNRLWHNSLPMHPAQRERLDTAVCEIFRAAAGPRELGQEPIRLRDSHMIDVVAAYVRAADADTPPVPAAFARAYLERIIPGFHFQNVEPAALPAQLQALRQRLSCEIENVSASYDDQARRNTKVEQLEAIDLFLHAGST